MKEERKTKPEEIRAFLSSRDWSVRGIRDVFGALEKQGLLTGYDEELKKLLEVDVYRKWRRAFEGGQYRGYEGRLAFTEARILEHLRNECGCSQERAEELLEYIRAIAGALTFRTLNNLSEAEDSADEWPETVEPDDSDDEEPETVELDESDDEEPETVELDSVEPDDSADEAPGLPHSRVIGTINEEKSFADLLKQFEEDSPFAFRWTHTPQEEVPKTKDTPVRERIFPGVWAPLPKEEEILPPRRSPRLVRKSAARRRAEEKRKVIALAAGVLLVSAAASAATAVICVKCGDASRRRRRFGRRLIKSIEDVYNNLS